MDTNPGFSTSFRVMRGAGGQWEVVEDGHTEALARFEAPQAALSFACSVAEARHGSLVVVFDQPRRGAPRMKEHRAPLIPYGAPASVGAQA